MVTNIEALMNLISTAQASYATLSESELKQSLMSNLGSFTEKEADRFIAEYTYIGDSQISSGLTGFQAALFEGNSGKKVLAIRGSEELYNDFGDADFTDIGPNGFATSQAVDLYRYWKKLITPTGEDISYSLSEISALWSMYELGDYGIAIDSVVFAAQLLGDTGLGLINSNEVVDVTGHSLGGNLAYVFASMFPQNTGNVVTINAPGIGGGQDHLLELGFSLVDDSKITSVNAEGDLVHHLGGAQPGTKIEISQEAGASVLSGDPVALNHSVINAVDSLNLMHLFAMLDPTQINAPEGIIKNIMRNSSNMGVSTYEYMLDSLRKLLMAGDIEPSPIGGKSDREKRGQLYNNMKELEESGHFVNLKGHVKLVSPSLNTAQAKSDYGQFLALYFAAPFALQGDNGLLSNLHWDLYSAWSADQSISAEDRKNGKANFSDEWYQDRTNYLSLLLERNAKDIDFNESANPNGRDAFYVNVEGFSNGTGRIFSGGVNASNINQEPEPSRIIFGTQADNNPANSGADGFVGGDGNDRIYGLGGDDKLNGLKGNDELYGGTGDDELTGGEGHDVLLGGEGTDTYTFEGNFGTDVIKDSDGSGSISIAGWSGSFTSVQGSDIIFRDDSQKIEAIKINNGTTTDLLITSLTDETTGNVLIKNWNPGNLGISLTIDTSTPSNGSAGTVNGDGGNNAITLDNLRDSNPNLDISTFSALSADGGGGNDIMMGMLQGNDTLLGGAGDDIISGGFTTTLGADASKTFQSVASVPGADSIDGGSGNDFIFASAGGSIAHGGSDNDILVSTGPAYFQFNNLKEVLADESRGITGHRAITRDEIYADAITRMNFGVTKNGLNYQLSNSYFKDFTSSYAEYNSAIENVKFIGKSGSTASNHSNGDVSYGFAGSYTLTYDYSNNGVLTPLSTGNPSPASMAISTFAPGAGKSLEDFANVKGANLFGDAGDDYLSGGIYADYLSGGADKDVVFAGAGNDIVDGGDGNDELHGGEGRDIIIGGQGDDTLVGDNGNDLLVGGEGKDGFIGGDGDDTLVGGIDDQYFSGGAGNNIYIFEDIVFEEADLDVATNNHTSDALGYASIASQTNGQTNSSSAPLLTIESTEGNNTLALVGVSSLIQISLTAQENDLILRAGNAEIFIRGGLSGAVDHLALGDSADEFKDSATSAKSTSIDNVMLTRLSTEVTRTAQTAGTQLAGGLLNDTLTAHVGGSILIGGQSDDTLLGNMGDDVYVIRAGDGFDSITEQGGNNTIKLTEGVIADQLALRRTNGNLLLILSSGQSVVVNGMFNTNTGELIANKAIHKIEFSNGEFWDLTRLLQESAKGVTLTGSNYNDLLIGYESSDTITGGKGNDKLRGDKGDDHYYFAIGDGGDQIDDNNGSDYIHFAEGINEVQVSLRKDTSNNLIVRINNSDSITVLNAFNAAGELTAQAIEQIHFNNSIVWDLARIKTELAKNQAHTFTGTAGSDQLAGDNANQIFSGGKGDDQLSGGSASDAYQYALGDGKDVVKDINGNDRLEFLAGINESEVVARRNGDDLVLTMKDGGSITIQNTFGAKAANVVDPVITVLIEQLQSHWMSQAEILIEQHYGLTGSGDITLAFEDGLEGAEAAHVEATYSEPDGTGTDLKLVIDLSDFSNIPNGTAPLYLDRIIAHEMVHAIMARNMNNSQLPGWFTEGTAEFIHGADDRVRGDANIIGLESNFNLLFKTTTGSPSTSAGYSVSYIAVKLLDKEIRAKGGLGIKEVFDQLKTGKTLDQSLVAVSAAHPDLATVWNNLESFETHFKAVGFAQYTYLLTLDNIDTGSIAGSDYGYAPLNASTVISETITGPSQHFNVVTPEQYIATPEMRGVLEAIGFTSGAQWDQARINQEVLKPTNGHDTIHAFDTNDILSGAKGNDQFFGYAGNDVYRYALGDGNDVITDSAGTDQIEFSADILAADIRLRRDLENNLVIALKDNSTITVKSAFDASGNFMAGAVESIRFLSGGTWDFTRITQEVLKPTNGDDIIHAFSTNDNLSGAKGNDQLFGYAGNDAYRYTTGDGNDVIIDNAGADQIEFSADIFAADIRLRRDLENNLVITLPDHSTLTVNAAFDAIGNLSTGAVESIKFLSGGIWDSSKIKAEADKPDGFFFTGTADSDTLIGTSSKDVLIGGRGDDLLIAGAGDDVYQYASGDGNDTIDDLSGIDCVEFGDYISPGNITVRRIDNDLKISLANGNDIFVRDSFDLAGNFTSSAIEQIKFSGGVSWDSQAIKSHLKQYTVIEGTNNSDNLYGTDADEYIRGLAGSDYIKGGYGDDTLDGGAGDDGLYGGWGATTYIFSVGYGRDSVNNGTYDTGILGLRADTIQLLEPITTENILLNRSGDNLAIKIKGRRDRLVVEQYFYQDGTSNNAVENLKFHDGTVWDINHVKEKLLITSSLDDAIYGYAAAELLDGLAGDDTIFSGNGNDSLVGGIGDDHLTSGEGDDSLEGGVGDDVLVGDDGADVIIGGAGNDALYGGNGADTYFFEVGFGHDWIMNDDRDPLGVNIDTIQFGEGIDPNDFSFSQTSYVGNVSLVISSNNGKDTLTIDRYLESVVNSSYIVDKIKFFGGVEWDIETIKLRALSSTSGNDSIYGYITNDTIIGGAGDDEILGYAGNDFLRGDSGKDILRGSEGSDTLNGGAGNDDLSGGDGADLYLYDVGSGQDTIEFYQNDTLTLGAGIFSNQITFLNIYNNYIILKVNDQGDSIVMSRTPSLSAIRFNDGSVWDSETIRNFIAAAPIVNGIVVNGTASGEMVSGGFGEDTLSGSAGNDTLDGGFGNDTLDGGAGNDVYIFGKGSGYDVINSNDSTANKIDTIEVVDGLLPSDVAIRRSGTDLILTVTESRASFTVRNYFRNDATSGNKVEKIAFANGVVWDVAFIKSVVLVPTENDDEIYGYATAETIHAGLGDDRIYAGSGNDVLDGGAGADVLDGGLGSDTFNFGRGYGSDIIQGAWDKTGTKSDVLQLGDGIVLDDLSFVHQRFGGLLISIKGTQDSISVSDYFSDDGTNNHFLDLVRFSDGSVLTYDQIRLMASIGTNADDTMYTNIGISLFGFEGSDYLYAEGGGGSLVGGDGDDILHSNGNNLLDGGAGKDFLENEYSAGIDNNIHIGGLDDDEISDMGGHDVYRFNVGDGFDMVRDRSGIDTLEFGIGITENDLIFTKVGVVGVEVSFKDSPYDKIYFSEWNLDNRTSYLDGKIELIKFFDGTSLSFDDAPLLDETIPWLSPLEITNDSTGFYIGGRAEESATVFIHDANGVQIGLGNTDTVYGYYSISVDKVFLTGEKLFLSVRDSAGNTSAPLVISTPDKTAPLQPSAIFDVAGKVITGIAEAGSTVIVKNSANTATLGTVTADVATGAFSVTLATALINKETVNVTSKDVAGNISLIKAIIAPDKTPPALPSASFDLTGKVISGSAEAGSVVEVKNTAGTVLGSVTANATNGTYSITLVTALINKETVNVTAKDTAGNISAIKTAIAPDKTAPIAPTANFDAAGKVVTGVAEAGSTVSVKNAAGTELKAATANATTGAYSVTLTTALINKELVNITAKDTAGNVSVITALIAPDKTAPTMPTASFDAAGLVITGVAEAGSTVSVKNAAGTELKTATANATTGAYSITLTTALINKETVNVTAKDAAGNISAIKAIIAPDKTAPSAPTASFDTAGLVISGVAEAGSTVSVKNAAGTELKTATANATTGAYSITLTTALINKETVSVTAKDAAGNISAIKSIVAPDKTAPSVPSASFDTAGKVITGVAEAGSTVSVKNAGGTELKTAVANATTGAYTITLTTALINKETVNVTAKDAAGNISAIKAIIAPDKTPPATPTASIDTARKVITGTSEAGSVVEVKTTTGSALGSITANATTGAYTITLATALTLNQTVNVTAKDAAGNVSAIKPLVASGAAMSMFVPSVLTSNLGTQSTIIAYAAEVSRVDEVSNTAAVAVDSTVMVMPRNIDKYISSGAGVSSLIQAMASFEPAVGVDTRYRAESVDKHHLMLAVGS